MLVFVCHSPCRSVSSVEIEKFENCDATCSTPSRSAKPQKSMKATAYDGRDGGDAPVSRRIMAPCDADLLAEMAKAPGCGMWPYVTSCHL